MSDDIFLKLLDQRIDAENRDRPNYGSLFARADREDTKAMRLMSSRIDWAKLATSTALMKFG
jgi:hypothetical protein